MAAAALGMKLCFLFALASVHSAVIPEEAVSMFQCPEGFVRLSTGCYHFSGSRVKNWWGAGEACRRMGAHLITIQDATENQMVGTYIMEHEPANHWLGASDLGHQSEWVWEHSGQPLTFFSWFPGQPDNFRGFEHCLHFKRTSPSNDITWNDMDCGKAYSYVCEADPLPVVPLQSFQEKDEVLEAVAMSQGKRWRIVGAIRMHPIEEEVDETVVSVYEEEHTEVDVPE